ncbi:MAG: hypothetical protein K6G62_04515 [Eubacterium sp.]|nr:hypothetical protein [Eubacterium sp.]
MNMNIDVSATDTLDTILSRLKKIAGADVYSSPNDSDGGSTYESYVSIYRNSSAGEVEVPVYTANGSMEVKIQSGANTEQSTNIVYRYLDLYQLGMDELELTTSEACDDSFEAIDTALEIVTQERSQFGAYENAFSYAIKNADNSAENLQSSESKIRDVNMADEMVNLSKHTITEQAAQAMLTQANQAPSRVLQLLS